MELKGETVPLYEGIRNCLTFEEVSNTLQESTSLDWAVLITQCFNTHLISVCDLSFENDDLSKSRVIFPQILRRSVNSGH